MPQLPHSLIPRWQFIAVCVLASLLFAAPVAAQEGRLPDAATKGDSYLGGRVILEGSDAPKNAGSDTQTAPVAFSAPATPYVGGCTALPGLTVYQATRYLVTATGYSRDSLLFTDPGCTVPLPVAR